VLRIDAPSPPPALPVGTSHDLKVGLVLQERLRSANRCGEHRNSLTLIKVILYDNLMTGGLY
jgi:hypothetical protein